MCSSFPGLLIGRTAVHSGKDPAFVAYDQFLSTGILQPLSRGEVRCGSVSVIRRCPLNVRFARKRTRLGVYGLEGIVSKREDSPYRSGSSPHWLKMKNPEAFAVKREAEEDWLARVREVAQREGRDLTSGTRAFI